MTNEGEKPKINPVEEFSKSYSLFKNIEAARKARSDPRPEVRAQAKNILAQLAPEKGTEEKYEKVYDYKSAKYFQHGVEEIASKINGENLEAIIQNETLNKAVSRRLSDEGRNAFSDHLRARDLVSYLGNNLKDEKAVKAVEEDGQNAYIAKVEAEERRRMTEEGLGDPDEDVIDIMKDIAKVTYATFDRQQKAVLALTKRFGDKFDSKADINTNFNNIIGYTADTAANGVREAYKAVAIGSSSKDEFNAVREFGYLLANQDK